MGYRVLMGAATALLAASYAAPAAAQTTFWACRVPAVGVLYMIADGSANCLDGAHVKFSWTDGGAPPANSVTSAIIVDGTIATADLAANSVNSAAIADGTIATGDIADGTIATADLADGAVSLAKLGVIPFIASANSSGTGNMSTTTYVSGGSITVNAPSAGRILLIVTAYCYVSNRDTLISYGLGPAVGTITGNLLYCGFGDAAASTAFYIPVIAVEQYAVGAGSTTIYFQASRFWGTGNASLSSVRLRALFMPE